MANQHGKLCAAAVIALTHGAALNEQPVVINTCFSFIDDSQAAHVASVHRYDSDKKTMVTVPGSGGVSARASAEEGAFAEAWAKNTWADMLA